MLQKLYERLEKQRIKNHLRYAEVYLRSKDISDFPSPLLKKREKMLDQLHKYWENGDFPKNTNHLNYRESYFVDDFGTPCAMGYLMLCDKQDKLVNKVKNSNNNVHLFELTAGSAYNWVEQSGFSQKEASLVQPSYGPCWPNTCPVNPLSQYMPWIVGTVTFIILEFLSFKLLGQPMENTRGKRVAGVAYYTIVNLVVSVIFGIVAKAVFPAYRGYGF